MSKQIREKLVQFQQQGAHKLILDLRDCALGDDRRNLDRAAFPFFRHHHHAERPDGHARGFLGRCFEGCLDRARGRAHRQRHAGPAEILASAIADNKRGNTVGDRTYGTASVQKLIEMDDGSALILTIANYFTPGNKDIPAEGVPPSTEVHPSIDDLLAQADLTSACRAAQLFAG